MKRSTKGFMLAIPLVLLLMFIYVSSQNRSQAQEPSDHDHDHASEIDQAHEGEPGTEESHEGHDHEEEAGIIHLEPEALEAAGVFVVPIGVRSLTESIALTGTVEPHPDGEAIIGSLIEGRVLDFFADIGDEVTAGQPLCAIESPVAWEAESEFINAKAELEYVHSDIERHRTLVAEGIGSMKELQELEARLKSAEAAYTAIEGTLKAISLVCEDFSDMMNRDCPSGVIMLTSPVDGAVVERTARVGMYIEPEDDLFHIVDQNRLRVRVEIPERYLDQLTVDSRATISLLHRADGELTGKIKRIAAIINTDTRTASAFITLENGKRRLVPNAFVSVRIFVGDESEEVLAVPIEAIIQDEHGDIAVYIEIEPHEFALKEIEVGRRIDGWVEVLDGLEKGERIVHAGAFVLHSESLKGQFGHGHAH